MHVCVCVRAYIFCEVDTHATCTRWARRVGKRQWCHNPFCGLWHQVVGDTRMTVRRLGRYFSMNLMEVPILVGSRKGNNLHIRERSRSLQLSSSTELQNDIDNDFSRSFMGRYEKLKHFPFFRAAVRAQYANKLFSKRAYKNCFVY